MAAGARKFVVALATILLVTALPGAPAQAASRGAGESSKPAKKSATARASAPWSYTRSYKIGNTTAAQAKAKLHTCFNCSFPVTGAPSRFPSPGTNLPLNVANFNFSCKFDKEFSGYDQGGSYWGYRFIARKEHVDGEGSTISFTFRSGRGASTLSVYGYIKNARPGGFDQPVYLAGASSTWAKFARNMTS